MLACAECMRCISCAAGAPDMLREWALLSRVQSFMHSLFVREHAPCGPDAPRTPRHSSGANGGPSAPRPPQHGHRSTHAGMPKSCQEGAAATAAVAKVICDELFALRASVPHTHSTCDTTIKAHMSCGVEDTCPVSRGVPHAIVGVCCRYRKHLPRWQWLQALAAFIAVAGGLLKGIATAGDSCRHRQPDGSDGGVHVMGHCPRCAVGASIVSCLMDCMTREAEVRSPPPPPRPPAHIWAEVCNQSCWPGRGIVTGRGFGV